MAYFDFPHTRNYDSDLGFLIDQYKTLNEEFATYSAVNKLQYADPIQWNITKAYTKFTIVTDNNKAFLAITNVPEGIQILNTDYWTMIGNLLEPGSITTDNLVNGCVTSPKIADSAVTNAKIANSAVSTTKIADSAVTAAKLASNSVTTDKIADHVVTKAKLQHRRYIMIGDSFGTQATSWDDIVKQNMGIPDEDYYTFCASGIGFIADGSNGFLNQLQSNFSSVSSPETITDVVVCGGLNDSGSAFSGTISTNIKNAIVAFCTYVHTNLPNAKVWIGYIGNALDDSSVIATRTSSNRRDTRYMYSMAQPDLDMEFAMNIDLYKALTPSISNFGADRLHPSESGSSALGIAISQWLNNGTVLVTYPKYDSGSGGWLYYIDNDELTMIPPADWLLNSSGTAIQGGIDHAVTTLNSLYFNEPIEFPMNIQVGTGGDYAIYPGQVKFYQNKVSFYIYAMTSSGWATLTTVMYAKPAKFYKIPLDIVN